MLFGGRSSKGGICSRVCHDNGFNAGKVSFFFVTAGGNLDIHGMTLWMDL